MPTILTSVAQIDQWKAAKSETEHLEFKEARDRFEFYKLLEYCVALANENEDGSVLVLGITDKPPRAVVGTKAFPSIPKVTSDLFDKLRFRIAVEEVMYSDRRVLVFRIPPRPPGHPYELDGKFLMRSGGQLVPMTVDQLKTIFAETKSASRRGPAYFVSVVVFGLIFVLGIFWFKHRLVVTPQPTTEKELAVAPPNAKASPETHDTPKSSASAFSTSPTRHPQSFHPLKAASQTPTQSGPTQTVPTQTVSPPVVQNPSPTPQTFQERVIQNNKALPKGDRERLADAFYQFAKNLDEGSDLMYKGFNEGGILSNDRNAVKSLPAHIAKLHELAASAKEYGKVSMALRTKWDYYREPTAYVFGDNPDNLGWGKLANAFDGYAYHLETWNAIQNKENPLVLNMLSEYKNEFDAMLTEYSRFNQGCKARLEEMRTSIR
jgi:hypothetical protein